MKKHGLLLPIVIVIGLVLAGCAEAPPPPSPLPHPNGFAQGIDMPTDARDYSQELQGSHVDFVARYYRDPGSRWPTLTAAEAKMMRAAGMRLVTVWEWHSGRPDYFSYASGYADAMAAYRQAKGSASRPAARSISRSISTPMTTTSAAGSTLISAASEPGFQAAAGSAPPDYRVGVYGSGAVCDYLKRMRLATMPGCRTRRLGGPRPLYRLEHQAVPRFLRILVRPRYQRGVGRIRRLPGRQPSVRIVTTGATVLKFKGRNGG